LFQGRRPPIVVASPSWPPFVAGFATGEFAPSFRVALYPYLVLYRTESPDWPTLAMLGHGAAAADLTSGWPTQFPSPRSNLGRPVEIRWLKSEDTLSAARFAK